MNSVLDAVVQRFLDKEEAEQEEFRGQLTAYRNLYAFLSQIIPYQDSDLEKLYAFVRNLISKLPPPGDGQAFALDDEIALRFFRLQQMTEGSIARRDVFDYIEFFYNPQRKHVRNGMLSPIAFEQQQKLKLQGV